MGLYRKLSLLSVAFLIFGLTSTARAEVIFSESFDDQPDWNSGLPENSYSSNTMGGTSKGGWDVDIEQYADTHVIPKGWDFVRQTPAYAPSVGHPDKHENIEISAASTAENPNRARGGTGKSFVTWRDSTEKQWDSDGLLGKYYSEGFDQLYVEFWINFSNEMIATYYNPDFMTSTTGIAKVFRIYHWNGAGQTFDYFDRDNPKNPNFLWQFEGRPASQSGYGFRNMLNPLPRRLTKYGQDPTESRFLNSSGNPSDNITTSYGQKERAPYGGVALADRRDGGLVDGLAAVDLDQVYGDETKWTKVAFFVKMNSAPGVYDGQLIQWLDDNKVIEINTMQWVSAAYDMVKWNVVALGGNDNFFKYPNAIKREEWYAIDDVKVSTEIPNALLVDSLKKTTPPNPPIGITIK
jgi:hypothetical protein